MPKRRSKLEEEFEKLLNFLNINYSYECIVIPYKIPVTEHKYKTDWSFYDLPFYIETKGWLSSSQERNKYILIKQQHPDIDLRFVFANPNKKCGRTKYTHADWAKKHGFKYCSIYDTETLVSWFNEKKE